jgi:hypothetical protein
MDQPSSTKVLQVSCTYPNSSALLNHYRHFYVRASVAASACTSTLSAFGFSLLHVACVAG